MDGAIAEAREIARAHARRVRAVAVRQPGEPRRSTRARRAHEILGAMEGLSIDAFVAGGRHRRHGERRRAASCEGASRRARHRGRARRVRDHLARRARSHEDPGHRRRVRARELRRVRRRRGAHRARRRRLAHEAAARAREGLLVGISAGANVFVALAARATSSAKARTSSPCSATPESAISASTSTSRARRGRSRSNRTARMRPSDSSSPVARARRRRRRARLSGGARARARGRRHHRHRATTTSSMPQPASPDPVPTTRTSGSRRSRRQPLRSCASCRTCASSVIATRMLPENAVELASRYDVVVEGSDNFATKFLVADACALARRPGRARAPPCAGTARRSRSGANGGPCYRCLFEDLPRENAPNCAEAGVVGPVVGVVGARAGGSRALDPARRGRRRDARHVRRQDARRAPSRIPRRAGCPLCGDKRAHPAHRSRSLRHPTPATPRHTS